MPNAKNGTELVRLQIPIPTDLSEHLRDLAADLLYTQPRLSRKLVVIALNSKGEFFSWLARKCDGGIAKRFNGKPVVVQVRFSEEETAGIETMADCFRHTSTRMAALLLEFAIHDHQWLETWLGKLTSRFVDQCCGRVESNLQADSPREGAA